MHIALDGMGGDYSPQETVKGAIETLKELEDIHIIITGDKSLIQKELLKYSSKLKDRVSIYPTTQIITMHDHPKDTLFTKKDSSLYKAIELVKNKEAVGIVSAGNTGAQMAISLFVLGRIKGIIRPAIAVPMPFPHSMGLLIDAGANTDCNAKQLVQFALMGKVYLENILKRKVTIGLLNIGTEEEKGSKLTQEAHQSLKNMFEEFKGHIEGDKILTGEVDVIVTDGFTGNIALKTIEGTAERIVSALKTEIKKSNLAALGALLMKNAMKNLFKQLDYETFGGSPLLGTNGISIIAHGRSSHVAIKNAIKMCYKMEKEKIIEKTIQQLNHGNFA